MSRWPLNILFSQAGKPHYDFFLRMHIYLDNRSYRQKTRPREILRLFQLIPQKTFFIGQNHGLNPTGVCGWGVAWWNMHRVSCIMNIILTYLILVCQFPTALYFPITHCFAHVIDNLHIAWVAKEGVWIHGDVIVQSRHHVWRQNVLHEHHDAC